VYHATKPHPGSLYESRNTSLQKSKLGPERGKCACGRRRKDASVYTYRSRTDRYRFHRCECGTEWTEHLTDIAPTDPVTSDEVIEVVTKHVPLKNSPMSVVMIYRLDGAYSRISDDTTAFAGGRTPRSHAAIVGFARDAELLAADRGWVRAFWEALRPHAVGNGEGYITAMVELDDYHVRSVYGPAKYGRLAPGQA